jgi:hypothetical protein
VPPLSFFPSKSLITSITHTHTHTHTQSHTHTHTHTITHTHTHFILIFFQFKLFYKGWKLTNNILSIIFYIYLKKIQTSRKKITYENILIIFYGSRRAQEIIDMMLLVTSRVP